MRETDQSTAVSSSHHCRRRAGTIHRTTGVVCSSKGTIIVRRTEMPRPRFSPPYHGLCPTAAGLWSCFTAYVDTDGGRHDHSCGDQVLSIRQQERCMRAFRPGRSAAQSVGFRALLLLRSISVSRPAAAVSLNVAVDRGGSVSGLWTPDRCPPDMRLDEPRARPIAAAVEFPACRRASQPSCRQK